MFGRKRQQRGAKQAGVSAGGQFAAHDQAPATGAGLFGPPRSQVSGPGGVGFNGTSLSGPQHERVQPDPGYAMAPPPPPPPAQSRFAPPAPRPQPPVVSDRVRDDWRDTSIDDLPDTAPRGSDVSEWDEYVSSRKRERRFGRDF